jgi:PilZ domain
VKTFTTTIVALKDEGLFVATKEIEFVNLLELGAEITLTFVNTDGKKYLFGAYKIAHILHESPVLILAKPWNVNFALLRRHFRFKLELPFYYLLDGNVHIGHVTDLSSCGVLAIVTSDPQLILGSQLAFQLKFPNFEPFQFKGEITRCETIEDNKLAIALDFLNVSEQRRQEISKCLLQCIYYPPT